MYSEATMKEHYDLAEKQGADRAVKILGISHSSLDRTIRKYKSTLKSSKKIAPPKVLLLDIETTPMETYAWSLRNNDYTSPTFIIKDWNLICWSAKWLYDSKMLSDVQTPHEARHRKDKRIAKSIYKLVQEADIVIGKTPLDNERLATYQSSQDNRYS